MLRNKNNIFVLSYPKVNGIIHHWYPSYLSSLSMEIQHWDLNIVDNRNVKRRIQLQHWNVFKLHQIVNSHKKWYGIWCSVPARNWKWRGATLEKGHFSTSKTMKKGNIVIFSKNVFQHYIFSSLHQIQCIYMTHCLYIFYYIPVCTEMQSKSEDQ